MINSLVNRFKSFSEGVLRSQNVEFSKVIACRSEKTSDSDGPYTPYFHVFSIFYLDKDGEIRGAEVGDADRPINIEGLGVDYNNLLRDCSNWLNSRDYKNFMFHIDDNNEWNKGEFLFESDIFFKEVSNSAYDLVEDSVITMFFEEKMRGICILCGYNDVILTTVDANILIPRLQGDYPYLCFLNGSYDGYTLEKYLDGSLPRFKKILLDPVRGGGYHTVKIDMVSLALSIFKLKGDDLFESELKIAEEVYGDAFKVLDIPNAFTEAWFDVMFESCENW